MPGAVGQASYTCWSRLMHCSAFSSAWACCSRRRLRSRHFLPCLPPPFPQFRFQRLAGQIPQRFQPAAEQLFGVVDALLLERRLAITQGCACLGDSLAGRGDAQFHALEHAVNIGIRLAGIRLAACRFCNGCMFALHREYSLGRIPLHG